MFKTNRGFVSRKIIAALVLAAAVISISLYSTREQSGSGRVPQKPAENKTGDINLAELTSRDSDRDGVMDWEEYLWGTDPWNPDTSGKGVGDLAEIKNKKSLLGKGSAPAPKSNMTETDTFSLNLFSSTMALKQSGNLTGENLKGLSSGISKNIAEEGREKTYYRLSDIKVAGPSASSTENYRDKMIGIANKYGPYGLGNELLIIAGAIDKNSPEKLKGLSENISLYRRLLEENLSVPTPEDMSLNHLSMVNAYRNIIESLVQAEKIWSDPVVGLIEITRYKNATNSLLIAMGKLELYFSGRDTISTTTP